MSEHSTQSAQKQNGKILQVFQNFFTKTLQIIIQSRSVLDSPPPTTDKVSGSKINKWFNLHIANLSDEWLRSELKAWKAQAETNVLPPMIIETYLDLRHLNAREIVMLENEHGKLWTVAEGKSKKQEVVIERWLLEFDQTETLELGTDELPLIYKQAIVLLRMIYTITRILPAFRLRKLVSKPLYKNVALCNRFIDGKLPISSRGRIGLSKPIIPPQHLQGSHMTQKSFSPIKTTMGSLRLSVAYRNHYNFKVVDHEERLSDQFLFTDKESAEEALSLQKSNSRSKSGPTFSAIFPGQESEEIQDHHPVVIKSSHETKFSLLPCSSIQNEIERTQSKKHVMVAAPISGSTGRPSIQPFKVGSISNSPPPQGTSGTPTSYPSGSIERRISITSHRSGSNASLAALLRNQRGSMSSSTTPSTIAAPGSQTNPNAVLFPRSISSSHGSHHQTDDHYGENVSSTPRFSSSFGSRQSRRFSSTSGRNNEAAGSILGTSVGLGSSGALISGLYIDDDISTFVRMIDGKSDLRLTHSESKTGPTNDSNTHIDALNRFQLLKSQHQQLGDSVSASLVLQRNRSGSHGSQSTNISKPISRKSSRSESFQPSVLPGSNMPSISSRLEASAINSAVGSASPRSLKGSFASPNLAYFKSTSNKLVSSPLTATTIAHATHLPGKAMKEGITGLSTSPSIYSEAKQPIGYHNSYGDHSGDFYSLGLEGKIPETPTHDDEMGFDNDDLLFEMTDTR